MSRSDGSTAFLSSLLPCWLVLSLFALVLRAAIPAGWMPSESVGTVTLVLCSGGETKAVGVDLGGAPAGHSSKEGQPCSFAAGAPPLLQAVALPFSVALFVAQAAGSQLPAPSVPEADAAWQTPPSQGP
jgi:hypothetical protein